MQHVEVERRFDAPPGEVWDVYTDHAGWSRWSGFPGSRLVREGREDRNGVGAVRAFAGGVREEILAFDPPRRMTYAVVGGPFPIRDHLGEVLFEPDGPGTRVTWRCRFEPRIPGTGRLVRAFIERSFHRALSGLARQLRGQSPT